MHGCCLCCECCVTILTESWLTSMIPDEAVQRWGFSLFRTDTSSESTGEEPWWGTATAAWSTTTGVQMSRSFHNTAHQAWQSIIAVFIYWGKSLLFSWQWCIFKHEPMLTWTLQCTGKQGSESIPEAVPIIVGDFNHSQVKELIPTYYQNISWQTRNGRSLDHCYREGKLHQTIVDWLQQHWLT